MLREIWATSSEWVNRVRGVSPSPGPTTWVLSANRRSAAECNTRARSRSKGLRSLAEDRARPEFSSTRRSASVKRFHSGFTVSFPGAPGAAVSRTATSGFQSMRCMGSL